MHLKKISLSLAILLLSIGSFNISIATENASIDNDSIEISETSISTNNADDKKSEQSKQSPQSKCVLEKYPADVLVDEPVIKRVDLTQVQSTVKVEKGEIFDKLIERVRTDDMQSLTNNQIKAALFRENKASFNKYGLIANAEIKIPTTERIALEKDSTGIQVEEQIRKKTILSYQIPELELPWAQEDLNIAKQKKKKAERDAVVAEIDKKYKACLDKENQKKLDEVTEADIADESMMIEDDEESYNEQGKRVFKLKVSKDELDNSKDTKKLTAKDNKGSSGGVEGSTLSFGGGKTTGSFKSKNKQSKNDKTQGKASLSSAEASSLQEELQFLREEIRQLKEDNELLRVQMQEDMQNAHLLLSVVVESVNDGKSINKHKIRQKQAEAEDNSVSYFFSVLAVLFLLSLAVGYAIVIIKKNKIRAIINETDSDEELEETEERSELDVLSELSASVENEIESEITNSETLEDVEQEAEELSNLIDNSEENSEPENTEPVNTFKSEEELDRTLDISSITSYEAAPIKPDEFEETEQPTAVIAHENLEDIKSSIQSSEPKEISNIDDVAGEWIDKKE